MIVAFYVVLGAAVGILFHIGGKISDGVHELSEISRTLRGLRADMDRNLKNG